MDPLEHSDELASLSDKEVGALLEVQERRRPGAPTVSSGVRPRRRPWSYRDIWRLEQLRAEAARRGLSR